MLWQVLRVEMASDDLLDCSTYFLSTSARLGKPNVGEHICVLQKVFGRSVTRVRQELPRVKTANSIKFTNVKYTTLKIA